MIAAGRAEAGSNRHIRLYRRPIERFRLPEKHLDAAFFMSETFPVIVSNQDLMSHFTSVAKLLRRGGVYCVDIDRHDGVDLVRKRKLWRCRTIKVGGTRVGVREYHQPIRWHGALHLIYELECTIHFPGDMVVTRDLIPVRYMTPPLMELAARASGCFKMIACYSDLSFMTPLDQCYGRWLGVLRRT
jgi:hypothetical protein